MKLPGFGQRFSALILPLASLLAFRWNFNSEPTGPTSHDMPVE